jgi:hypothetical protein
MDQAARVHVQLAFGTDIRQQPAGAVVRDRLYRVGFFSEARDLRRVALKLSEEGYAFTDSVLANALRRLSIGKTAVLTRGKVDKKYVYRERLPPSEFFKTIV